MVFCAINHKFNHTTFLTDKAYTQKQVIQGVSETKDEYFC